MIAQLFHADLTAQPSADHAGLLGTTTIGSSEAVMLALLTHKWNWKARHRHNPRRSAKDQPYLIIGTHTHACFAKFARYFDVAVKWISLTSGCYAVHAEQVKAILETRICDDPEVMEACGYPAAEVGERRVGELVMAVGCVVGTTYTGDLDDVAGIDALLTQGNWPIPIHVDAATGGFILPFTPAENASNALLWDFRLPHVQSINVSNHKYGLVYPGLGTIIFRNPTIVPEALLVDVPYLSGHLRNFSLNFSRPSSGVVLQYYNFLRLGKSGYQEMVQSCLATAQALAAAIQSSATLQSYFEIISRTDYFPVVALRIKVEWVDICPFTLTDLAQVLKSQGWIVPVYHLPAHAEQIEVLRVVVRSHFTPALACAFLRALERAVQWLMGHSLTTQHLSVHQQQ